VKINKNGAIIPKHKEIRTSQNEMDKTRRIAFGQHTNTITTARDHKHE